MKSQFKPRPRLQLKSIVFHAVIAVSALSGAGLSFADTPPWERLMEPTEPDTEAIKRAAEEAAKPKPVVSEPAPQPAGLDKKEQEKREREKREAEKKEQERIERAEREKKEADKKEQKKIEKAKKDAEKKEREKRDKEKKAQEKKGGGAAAPAPAPAAAVPAQMEPQPVAKSREPAPPPAESKKQPEPVKSESAKSEPVKSEPVKSESVKPEPAKSEPAKSEPVKSEPAKSEPVKSESVKSEPAKSEPVKPEPAKPEPVKPEPAKPEPVKPEPVKPEPVKTEPVKPEPVKTEPVKPEPVKPEPAKPEPAKTEPVKTEPVKPEPAKPAEPVKKADAAPKPAEPVSPEPVIAEPSAPITEPAAAEVSVGQKEQKSGKSRRADGTVFESGKLRFGIRASLGVGGLGGHEPAYLDLTAVITDQKISNEDVFLGTDEKTDRPIYSHIYRDRKTELGASVAGSAGLMLLNRINSLLSWSCEAQYSFYMASGSITDENAKGVSRWPISEATVELHYLEIPVLLRISAEEALGYPIYGEVGPQFGFNVYARRTENDDGALRIFKPNRNIFAIGPVLGAGIDLDRISVDLRAYFGLTTYQEYDGGRPWSLTVGVTSLF